MPNQNIKILFFGTSAFAVPILQKLIDAKYDISAVVTQPDKPVGRKQILTPSPVKILAQKYGILIQQPEKLSLKSIALSGDSSSPPHFDAGSAQNDTLIITASYGKIIPKEILDFPKYGALNVHPSLLPKYRGPSPIQYAILNGEKVTGVTIMLMDEKMDHGPILAQEKITMDAPPVHKPRFQELHNTLSQLGADLLIKTIPKWISDEIKPVPQDDAAATYTRIIEKEDGKIDWKKSAIEIERQIRAFTPWPGCWTIMNIGERKKRVKIIEAHSITENDPVLAQHGQISVSPESPERDPIGRAFYRRSPLRETAAGQQYSAPGKIIITQNKKMAVECGAGHLEVLKLQPEGKKEMSGVEFLGGYGNVEKFIYLI